MLDSFRLTVLLIGAAAAHSAPQHPLTLPQPDTAPAILLAGVEISAGSIAKYEVHPVHGMLLLDRFQSMPVVYPANYGFLPSTSAADGDALDVLVLTREPVVPGAFLYVRPIGMLELRDGGERDDKIIAVPADDVDPDYRHLRELTDLPVTQRDRIEAFFRVYKNLPEGRKSIEIYGYQDAKAARAAIAEALAAAAGE